MKMPVMKTLYQNLDLCFTIEQVPVHALTLALNRQVQRIPSHSHGPGCYEIHYISSGCGSVRIEETDYPLAAGTVYLTGAGVAHSETPLPDNPMYEYCLYFRIDTERLKNPPPLLETFVNRSLWIGKDRQKLLPLLQSIATEMQTQPRGYQEVLSALLKQFLLFFIRNLQEIPQNRHSYLHQDLTGQKSVIAEDYFLYEYQRPSLSELALRLGLSKRQTERFLKDFYGKTFLQKRTEARMSAAAVLLAESDASITEISEKSGYSSPEHFTNAFRAHFGVSPRSFRKERKEKFL